MIRDQRQPGDASSTSGSTAGSVDPGKRTLIESLPVQRIEATSGAQAPGKQPVAGSPASPAAVATQAAPDGMWEHTFGEASTPVGKLARVQAPRGVYLRVRPLPGAESPGAAIPFNGLVHVERRTTQAHANERWCYVIAIDAGTAGFCEERYLAIDPPEPTAQLRRIEPHERLAAIAEAAYGPATDDMNARLRVQALYLANRDRAGITLDRVDLGFADRALRGEDEEQTLKIYKGATVIAGDAIWIPSEAFLEQLTAAGAVTGGSTYATRAWNTAKDTVGHAVDDARYAAGFMVGMLEGAYNAIVDLFKGAVEMVEAVVKVVWSLVTQNPRRIKDMLVAWVAKMKRAWEHRGAIADEFLEKWNADSTWDRGLFQGEVLGWLAMTVLLVLITLGEAAPGALGSIAVRWPRLVQLVQTVDTLGDVTTYLGAAARATKLPKQAADFVASKLGKAAHGAEHVADEASHAETRASQLIEQSSHRGADAMPPQRSGVAHPQGPGAAHIHDESFSANRTFERSNKHTGRDRNVGGRKVAKEPTDGQAALDFSFQVSNNSPRRIGIDVRNSEIVVFDRTGNRVTDKQVTGGIFHGHVRSWDELEVPMKKLLEERGLVRNGKITVDPSQWLLQ